MSTSLFVSWHNKTRRDVRRVIYGGDAMGLLELPGGAEPSNYRKISADDFSFDTLKRKLKQAQADVLLDKANRTSDPLKREILRVKSSLITLRLKQSEDRRTT